MIAAGVGVALLPALALTNMRDDIVVRSLGRRAPSRQMAAATLAGRFRSPATEAMLGILREVAGRLRAARRRGCRRLIAALHARRGRAGGSDSAAGGR